MLYFKKAELAEDYHVSQKTVTNWIRQAKEGKLDLELHEEHDRTRIANTTRNIILIKRLVEERRKFRNTRAIKSVSPKPEFYKLYSQQQIFDISSSLDIYREVAFQYRYLIEEVADYWDRYAQRLAAEEIPNLLNVSTGQLNLHWGYIDDLLSRYSKINVVDVGVGNALPVKDLLQRLIGQRKLGRYIGVDISPAMLRVAQRNIKSWFGTKVRFEGYEADINHDRLTDLLMSEVLDGGAEDTANLVLVLGGTFGNLRTPDSAFQTVHDSMNRNDFLIHNLKLDSKVARRYFDFAVDAELQPLDTMTRLFIDLLNVDESFYDAEIGYDEQLGERYARIRLKVALTITFKLEKGERVIEFNKNDTILVWRYWHQTAQQVTDQLNRNGFDTLQASQTEDKDYLLTISRVKRES